MVNPLPLRDKSDQESGEPTVGVKHDRYEVGEVTQSSSSSFFPLFPAALTLVGTRTQGEGMVVGFAAAPAADAFGVEIPQKRIGSDKLVHPRRIPIIRSLNQMALSPGGVYPSSRRSSSEETGECGRSGTGDEGRYAVVGCAELQGWRLASATLIHGTTGS